MCDNGFEGDGGAPGQLAFQGTALLSNIEFSDTRAALASVAAHDVTVKRGTPMAVTAEELPSPGLSGFTVEHLTPGLPPELQFTLHAPPADQLLWLLLGKHGNRAGDSAPVTQALVADMLARIPPERRVAHRLHVSGLADRTGSRPAVLEFFKATLRDIRVVGNSPLRLLVTMECGPDYLNDAGNAGLAYYGRVEYLGQEPVVCTA